jgi:hypothetical protein
LPIDEFDCGAAMPAHIVLTALAQGTAVDPSKNSLHDYGIVEMMHLPATLTKQFRDCKEG